MAEAFRRLPGPARELLKLAVVALAYYIAARLSLQLALVRGQVTPVWPPTGIALVSMLVLGPRVWPAVTVAFIAVRGFAAEQLVAGFFVRCELRLLSHDIVEL